jgi:3-isopropylmalate dehydrogenase
MQLRVTSLPGDGIGPEVTSQAICVLEEVASGFGHDLELDEKEIGGVALEKFGNPLPDSTIQACLASQAVLLGAVGSPAFDHNPRELRPEAGLLRLRQELGAFANLRPAVFLSDAGCVLAAARRNRQRNRHSDRARTAGRIVFRRASLHRRHPRRAQAVNTMRYSEPEIERIARVAFQLARTRAAPALGRQVECSGVFASVARSRHSHRPRFFRCPALPHVRGLGRHVAGAEAGGVRRHPHREHVRRHPVR